MIVKTMRRRICNLSLFIPSRYLGAEPDEIRHLGARINRHLFNLTEELKNFSYAVQKRMEE